MCATTTPVCGKVVYIIVNSIKPIVLSLTISYINCINETINTVPFLHIPLYYKDSCILPSRLYQEKWSIAMQPIKSIFSPLNISVSIYCNSNTINNIPFLYISLCYNDSCILPPQLCQEKWSIILQTIKSTVLPSNHLFIYQLY